MNTKWDVIIVGSGPAGMACACAASEKGLEVLVLDEQPVVGGQIYRNISRQADSIIEILGNDYKNGFSLVKRFKTCGVTLLSGSTAWKLEHDGRVCFSKDEKSMEVKGKRVVIATGAMERPVPFAGWTLPGVVGAGAVDAFLKSDGIIPKGPITMVGSGPIMFVVAGHMKKLGVEVSHFFDTTPQGAIVSALGHLPRALGRLPYLLSGVGMLASTWKNVGSYKTKINNYEAIGSDEVHEVRVMQGETLITVPAKTVLVHEGLIPRTEFSRQLGLDHSWDQVQRFWYPTVDKNGRTSSEKIFMAGDGAFVHGAIASEIKGEIAALTIVEDLMGSEEQVESRKEHLRKALRYELLPRPFIDAMYRPRPNMADIGNDVTVCRCEEVKAGQIKELINDGQTTPEMIKAVSRVGMGPCQGRMCSCSLSEIVADKTGQDIEQIGTHNIRPPVRNIGLGELANMTLLPTQNNNTVSDS